jgi:hypothetical protein
MAGVLPEPEKAATREAARILASGKDRAYAWHGRPALIWISRFSASARGAGPSGKRKAASREADRPGDAHLPTGPHPQHGALSMPKADNAHTTSRRVLLASAALVAPASLLPSSADIAPRV